MDVEAGCRDAVATRPNLSPAAVCSDAPASLDRDDGEPCGSNRSVRVLTEAYAGKASPPFLPQTGHVPA
jgi:hypothetical protein